MTEAHLWKNFPWSPPLYNFICGYKIDMANNYGEPALASQVHNPVPRKGIHEGRPAVAAAS